MSRQQVEQQILVVLAEEKTAVGISDKLFTPNGLFSRLASNEEERRVLVKTPLFQKAQQRFRELQFKEAEEFRQAVSNIQGTELAQHYALKVEPSRPAQ